MGIFFIINWNSFHARVNILSIKGMEFHRRTERKDKIKEETLSHFNLLIKG